MKGEAIFALPFAFFVRALQRYNLQIPFSNISLQLEGILGKNREKRRETGKNAGKILDNNRETLGNITAMKVKESLDNNEIRLSGDTLRDYKRYFSDYDYTQWDNDIFLEQKQLFGMTKWSNSLCVKFQKQCQEMEKAFIGLCYL